MAEAILRRLAGDQFEVFSAGTEPGKIHPLTRQVLEEQGYDLSDHSTKPLSQFLGKVHFGIGVTVCSKAEKACPILPGIGTRLHWPFDDPADFPLTKKGNPKIGHFTYAMEHDPTETEVTYVVPVTGSGPFHIADHAVVYCDCTEVFETAWGQGCYTSFPGSSWAIYFTFTV